MYYITLQGDDGDDFTEYFVPRAQVEKVKEFLINLDGVVTEEAESIITMTMRLGAEEVANDDFPDEEWDAALKRSFNNIP